MVCYCCRCSDVTQGARGRMPHFKLDEYRSMQPTKHALPYVWNLDTLDVVDETLFGLLPPVQWLKALLSRCAVSNAVCCFCQKVDVFLTYAAWFETQLIRLIEKQTLHNWYPAWVCTNRFFSGLPTNFPSEIVLGISWRVYPLCFFLF